MRWPNIVLGVVAAVGGVILVFRLVEDDIVMGVFLLVFALFTLTKKD